MSATVRPRGRWWPALLLAAAGCGGQPDDPARIVVAEFSGDTLTLAQFDRYLAANLILEEGDPPPADELALVRSRLFDDFVTEAVLGAAARGRGIEVDALEVEAYRDSLEREPIEDPEIVAFLDENREKMGETQPLRLRSLRFESAETAARVAREIRRGRLTFDEAVVAHGEGPGQGVPLSLSPENLPEAVREALHGLAVGRVTPPVEWNEEVYLFQMLGRADEVGFSEVELRERARAELMGERRGRVRRDLQESMKRDLGLRLHTGRLPFRYIPDPNAPNSQD